jgi:hypothetical protein
VSDIATVVRVSGRAAGNHPDEIPRGDGVGVGPADPHLGAVAERIDTARAHTADPAAYPERTEAALGLHGVESIPDDLDILRCRTLDHLA